MAKGKIVARTGIKRDNKFMYFIKEGAVWRVPRKRPGVKAKGKKERLVQFADKGSLDYSKSLYFLDGKGNVVASPRARRKTARKTARKTTKATRKKRR